MQEPAAFFRTWIVGHSTKLDAQFGSASAQPLQAIGSGTPPPRNSRPFRSIADMHESILTRQ
jgi:hypothetical protein